MINDRGVKDGIDDSPDGSVIPGSEGGGEVVLTMMMVVLDSVIVAIDEVDVAESNKELSTLRRNIFSLLNVISETMASVESTSLRTAEAESISFLRLLEEKDTDSEGEKLGISPGSEFKGSFTISNGLSGSSESDIGTSTELESADKADNSSVFSDGGGEGLGGISCVGTRLPGVLLGFIEVTAAEGGVLVALAFNISNEVNGNVVADGTSRAGDFDVVTILGDSVNFSIDTSIVESEIEAIKTDFHLGNLVEGLSEKGNEVNSSFL
mmetsp:Transcript_32839/g.29695  ORF Transcript_32839/g.29695 Transcript_32839/m.29695 type:complete len:267 (-) Transcript_32839:198-998(-)